MTVKGKLPPPTQVQGRIHCPTIMLLSVASYFRYSGTFSRGDSLQTVTKLSPEPTDVIYSIALIK